MKKSWSRRDFIKIAGCGTVGTILVPSLNGCSRSLMQKPISFTGELKGEDYITGHLIRDGRLKNQPVTEIEPFYEAVIIGGGPAGLATAWKLSQAGHNHYLILEKEGVFGGLCRGDSSDGIPFACGAHYVDYPSRFNQRVIEFYNECGILDGFSKAGMPLVKDEFLVHPPKHNLFVNGRWQKSDYPFDIASAADVKEYDRFFAYIHQLSFWQDAKGKKAIGLPLSAISEEKQVRDLDTLSMADFLKKNNYHSALLNWYINVWLIDEYGTPIEKCSAWAAIHFFHTLIGLDELKKPGRTVTFPEGLSYLVKKIEKKLPAQNFFKNCYAVKVENIEGGVQTLFYSLTDRHCYSVNSRYAVFAIPKNQAYYVIPQLKEANRKEFENLQYAAWLIAIIYLKRLPEFKKGSIAWENTIYNSWTMGYINNHHLEKPKRSPDKPHIVSMYACLPYQTGPERKELLKYGWDYWARVLLAELQKAHPEIESLIQRMDIWKWGHPMRQVEVGTVWGQRRLRMLEPFGKIFFSHADVCGLPIFEEAICRGVEIAEKIISSVE